MSKYLCTVPVPNRIITPIDAVVRFPELLAQSWAKYGSDIALFRDLISTSDSSAHLLERIRSPTVAAATRTSLLKMFRRCVAPVLDTETSGRIRKITTAELVESYADFFTPIAELQAQFAALGEGDLRTLAALIAENDLRGQSGYALTERFFAWFEAAFAGVFTIDGPRRAGRDVELRSVFADFIGGYPCDFVIRAGDRVLAVGFARYDATRGGSQSDDRTAGNWAKVEKARQYCDVSGAAFRILFLADGPGLGHRDTWQEACDIDGEWDGNVRVTTLKLAAARVTRAWLLGEPETSGVRQPGDLFAELGQ